MDVTLSIQTARHIAGLLMMLTELPSTPDVVADGARLHLSAVSDELPGPHHGQQSGGKSRHVVELDEDTATAIAELLEMLDEMGSTPPSVATEARSQAEHMRSRLAQVTSEDISSGRPPSM